MKDKAQYVEYLKKLHFRESGDREFELRLMAALPWLIEPSRWRASREELELTLSSHFDRFDFQRALSRRKRDVVAHRLVTQHGWEFADRSASGSIYLYSPMPHRLRVRISDHPLRDSDGLPYSSAKIDVYSFDGQTPEECVMEVIEEERERVKEMTAPVCSDSPSDAEYVERDGSTEP